MALYFTHSLLQFYQRLLVLMVDFGQVKLAVELEVLFRETGRQQAAFEVKRLNLSVSLTGKQRVFQRLVVVCTD
jgi:hypothetical protein